jgi:hypothetical protein
MSRVKRRDKRHRGKPASNVLTGVGYDVEIAEMRKLSSVIGLILLLEKLNVTLASDMPSSEIVSLFVKLIEINGYSDVALDDFAAFRNFSDFEDMGD